jgi:anaerobic ribonucleoside-triphosphate reductase
MKNTYYQNNSKFSKGSFQKQKTNSYIPAPPKQDRKPKFYPGDTVGFRGFLSNQEATIIYYRRDKKGAIEYVVKLTNSWSAYDSGEQVFKACEMYLKPLTRKVLFEKAPAFRREAKREMAEMAANRIIISGTTSIITYIDLKTT